MNTFKDFFKKHLALNLVALILPIVLYILAYFLLPEAYAKWQPFHPALLFITLFIIAYIGLICLVNTILITHNKVKKIVSIIFFYVAFFLCLLSYFYIEYFIFHPRFGFIADVTDTRFPHPEWITDALYTILAQSFVTIFVIIGVIIFTVYLIKSAKKNKQQPIDTTTE